MEGQMLANTVISSSTQEGNNWTSASSDTTNHEPKIFEKHYVYFGHVMTFPCYYSLSNMVEQLYIAFTLC